MINFLLAEYLTIPTTSFVFMLSLVCKLCMLLKPRSTPPSTATLKAIPLTTPTATPTATLTATPTSTLTATPTATPIATRTPTVMHAHSSSVVFHSCFHWCINHF